MSRIVSIALLLCVGIGAIAYAAESRPTEGVKINDSIHMASANSSVYMVITPAGNVIIDTAIEDEAADARKLLVAVNHGPVKYIILTHGHADRIGGIPLWKEAGTQIHRPKDVEFLNYTTRLDAFLAPRNGADCLHLSEAYVQRGYVRPEQKRCSQPPRSACVMRSPIRARSDSAVPS